MKLSVLEYFIALAESRSINQAAQKVNISQPCLTRALQSFEREIGVQLFYRDKSGIVLTEAGKRVLPEAKQILKYYNGWQSLSALEVLPQIDLYSMHNFSLFLVPDIFFDFKKRYPNTVLNLVSAPHPELYISKDVNRPVLALTICGNEQIEEYRTEQGNAPILLFEGAYQCIVNHRSSLARREKIALRDLEDLFLVSIRGTTDESYRLPEVYRSYSDTIRPSHCIEVESLSNLISLLCKNPETYAFSFYPMVNQWDAILEEQLLHIPVENVDTTGTVCLFYSRQAYQQHPAVRDLVKEIRNVAKSLIITY